jgi:hypothetical protein
MTGSRAVLPLVASLVLAIGCGRVGFDPDPDARPQVCLIHDTVDSCGASCARCPPAGDREVATCDGMLCGIACAGSAPRCTDNSCARLAWTFDSGALDGITPRAPETLVLTVRDHGGNPALAIDVIDLFEVQFTVPICLSGSVALTTRTLTATVMFDGEIPSGPQYYLQTSIPEPMTGAYLAGIDLESGSYYHYSAPLSASQFAGAATTIVFQAGTLGAHFSGTLWFDDILVQ